MESWAIAAANRKHHWFMNPNDYLNFLECSLRGLLSWVFAFAVGVKIVSTLVGLWRRNRSPGRDEVGAHVWWISKISALVVAASVFSLSVLAADRTNQIVFGGVLLIAVCLVATMAVRRQGCFADGRPR